MTKHDGKFVKLQPDQVAMDPRFQRNLDERRVKDMVPNLDLNRIGVPVVSARDDGSYIAIDGQHRISALKGAGYGTTSIMMEVHHNLSLEQEAQLFLELNSNRRAVGALDKFKARVVAKESAALQMKEILGSYGLRAAAGCGPKAVNAIEAVEFVFLKRGNLSPVLAVLTKWADGDPNAFNGQLIKAVAEFLAKFPEAKPLTLAKQLEGWAPDRVLAKIKRLTSNATPKHEAFCDVFFEIYNHRLKRSEKLTMVTSIHRAAVAAAKKAT